LASLIDEVLRVAPKHSPPWRQVIGPMTLALQPNNKVTYFSQALSALQ
jgi:hypothetical protein